MGGEGADFGGGGSFAAVKADGKTDDEGANPADFCELGNTLDRGVLAQMDGFNRMGKDAEVVGGGDADADIAIVDAERGVRGVGGTGGDGIPALSVREVQGGGGR